MAARFPLIANSSSNQIQELASGDDLNLTGNSITGAGIITATTFSGNITGNVTGNASGTAGGLTGTPNITVGLVAAQDVQVGGAVTIVGNLTVDGTQTIINTATLDVEDKTVGLGSTSTATDSTADGAGVVVYASSAETGNDKTILWKNDSDCWTFSESIDMKGAVETVSVASTAELGTGGYAAGRVIVECDAKLGTVFTHNLSSGNVGILSVKNFPVTKNSFHTIAVIFTQNTAGTGNTTAATGIGTNITLNPLGASGFTTSTFVGSGTTITLSSTGSDVDIVTLGIHYNGSGSGSNANYRTFGTKNGSFRHLNFV